MEESKTEICMLRRRIADLEKERQADKEKIKELEEEIDDWKFTKNYVEDNYIHKNEIKTIIEELQEDIKYSKNPLSIDNSKFGIKVLQSLLEEE